MRNKNGSDELIGDIIALDVIYERNDTDYGDTVIGKEFDGV